VTLLGWRGGRGGGLQDCLAKSDKGIVKVRQSVKLVTSFPIFLNFVLDQLFLGVLGSSIQISDTKLGLKTYYDK